MKGIHLQDTLEVKASDIPHAGQGLFAKKAIRANTVIGNYLGKKMKSQEYQKLEIKAYVWGLSSGKYVDGFDLKKSNLLRFANDCYTAPEKNNLEALERDDKIYYVTKRDIFPGEELLIGYGERYWSNSKYLLEEINNGI